MKAMFNGKCYECKKLKPRCTLVHLKDDLPNNEVILCADCRADLRGCYVVHDKHRSPSEIRPLENEYEFTTKVLKLASVYGWKTLHIRPAMVQSGSFRTPYQGDGKGFPDLLLMKKDKMIAAELKADHKNQATAEQVAWLESFYLAGASVFVWRPDDWVTIEMHLNGVSVQNDEEAKAVLVAAYQKLREDPLPVDLARQKRRQHGRRPDVG